MRLTNYNIHVCVFPMLVSVRVCVKNKCCNSLYEYCYYLYYIFVVGKTVTLIPLYTCFDIVVRITCGNGEGVVRTK